MLVLSFDLDSSRWGPSVWDVGASGLKVSWSKSKISKEVLLAELGKGING